jgi:PKD repeat protein
MASIHHNLIASNSAGDYGGGIYLRNCAATVFNNDIRDNSVVQVEGGAGGGGTAVRGEVAGSKNVIQNNLLIANQAPGLAGGGAYLNSSNVEFINNLLIDNVAASGGGVEMEEGATPNIRSNIFVRNGQYAVDCNSATSTGRIIGNCFFNNAPGPEQPLDCNLSTDSNLFGLDPLFVDEVNGDFHLQSSSPLINSGDPLLPPEIYDFDYDGFSRVVYGHVDVGPFEFVDCNLAAAFEPTTDVVCTLDVVTFENTSTGQPELAIWDFGDGTVDTLGYADAGQEPTHAYDSVGIYTISLTLQTECDSSITSRQISVVSGPTAAFSFAADSGACAPLTVTFVNETEGVEISYWWDFGDGDTSVAAEPVHEYSLPGDYQVTLIAVDQCGADTVASTVEVIDIPAISFVAEPTSGSAPLTVNFYDSSLYTPNEWEWDFGDDSTSNEQNPVHTYMTAGVYDVTLDAANVCGSGYALLQVGLITVAGFELASLESDTSDRFEQVFTVLVDSLFGPFDNWVTLSTVFSDSPRRGTVEFSLSADSVLVPDTVTLTAHLGRTLAQGEYEVALVGQGAGSNAVDSLPLLFRSRPDSLIRLTRNDIDFDSVQIDSVEVETLIVRNIGPFEPPLTELNLRILDAYTDNPHYTVANPHPEQPIPTNGGAYYLEIEFAPTIVGEIDATLTIISNDPVAPTITASLIGVGIEERNPPEVISSYPMPGATEVLIRQPIELTVSEAVDSTSVNTETMIVESWRLGAPLPGSLAVLNGNVVQFTPESHYPPFDTLRVTLSAVVTDLVGNGLDGNLDGVGSLTPADNFSFTFSTGPGVYPGDCNNDGIVNEVDVLPIGIYFGQTGFARDSLNENVDENLQQARLWDDTAATYADANGDGVVNRGDITTIRNKWGLTHNWPSSTLSPDLNYSEYADNFAQLRQDVENLAGTDRGDQMLQVVDAYASTETLPEDIVLLQNYPNPFNPMTRIDYALPEGMAVRLSVHNILGQTVKVLADGYQSAGFKNVIWDGTDEGGMQVSSGMYFYRLEAGSFVEIRKMLKIQ